MSEKRHLEEKKHFKNAESHFWDGDCSSPLSPSAYSNCPRCDLDLRRMERDIMRPMNRMMTDLNGATRALRREMRDVQTEVSCDNNKFQVRLDCHNFNPEELTVRHVRREMIIEGKHEERADEYGFTSRTFTRRYRLPEDCNVDNVNVRCDWSSDGFLTINIPRHGLTFGGEGSHLLKIQQTGKPALPA